MARKIIAGVVLVIALLLFYYWYTTSKNDSSMDNGDVHAVNPGGSKSEPPQDYVQPNSKNNLNTPAPVQTSNQPPGGAPAPVQDNPVSTSAATTAAPTTDTVAPNPPNGMAFTGTGRYQWYRQGNLTWRVDSQNGNSCIAFATDEEWRKPRVYSSGCANR